MNLAEYRAFIAQSPPPVCCWACQRNEATHFELHYLWYDPAGLPYVEAKPLCGRCHVLVFRCEPFDEAHDAVDAMVVEISRRSAERCREIQARYSADPADPFGRLHWRPSCICRRGDDHDCDCGHCEETEDALGSDLSGPAP